VLIGISFAMIAFVIKILAKLILSSYHAMRDAQERELLTSLYLSMIDGAEKDDMAKSIVYQSLFSRSDTGLLNTESSPTMPSNLADIIKSLKVTP